MGMGKYTQARCLQSSTLINSQKELVQLDKS